MKQGIALSVGASFLFAVIYYFAAILEPLTGGEIFGWRIVLGLPALALVMTKMKRWNEVLYALKRLFKDFRFFLLLCLSAFLFGTQTWLFVWAPLHHKALDVSLGYFLLPLIMVLVGRLFYKEKLTWMQWLAVGLAASGVIHEFWRVNSFSWATALVAFGYPPYFMLRRHLRLGALTSLWFDFSFLLVPALYILLSQEVSLVERFLSEWRFFWQVPVFGVISSVALVGYISASRMLPLTLFGLLSYVEPILLFWVAFLLLGEPIAADEWWTYIPIWLAVACVALEGMWKLRREMKIAKKAI